MDQQKFEQVVPGRQQWYIFLLSFLFLVSGILGFGDSAALIALVNHGLSLEEVNQLTMADIQDVLGKNLTLIVTLFRFVIGFGIFLLSFRFIHRSQILAWFTQREHLDLRRFMFSFGLTFLFFGLVFGADYLLSPEHFTFQFNGNFFTLLLISIFLVPFQTGLEELFFRSFLMKWIGKARSRAIIPVIASSAIFMLLHGANPEIDQLGFYILPYYFLAGIFASVITLLDEGIELSWGFHTANNFISILIVTNTWQVFQTDALFVDHSQPVFTWFIYLPILIIYPLLFFIFRRKYAWESPMKRIFG